MPNKDAALGLQLLMIRDLAESAIAKCPDPATAEALELIRQMADEAQGMVDHGIVSEPVDTDPPTH